MLPNSSILAVFGFSFVVGFGAVVSPGPVSAAIIAQSPRRGWLVGPLVATGHSFLELIIVMLIAFGLTTTLAQSYVQNTIALLGGLMLMWMGLNMGWGAYRDKIKLPGKDIHHSLMDWGELITLGVVTTLSNPFWYAWWITVAAGYLAQAQSLGAPEVAAFYLGHISADYAWDTVLSAVIGSGRNWITPKIYRGIILLCGVFIGYLGVVFIINGIMMSST